MRVLLFLSICFGVLPIWAAEEMVIREERGYYQIDFEKIYTLYIHQDIETMVSLPTGYKLVSFMPGSRDYCSINKVLNTIYISRPVPDEVMTNLTLQVLTPEGFDKKLVFKLIGKKNAPKILAVQFLEPNTSELNRTIEEIKSRYNDQLSQTLAVQEKTLTENIHKEICNYVRHWMFTKKRGEVEVSYKGAKAFIDGMFNDGRGSTIIQVRTTVKMGECDVIKLSGVKMGKGSVFEVEFIETVANEDNTFTYVYKMPEVPILEKKNKYRKIKVKYFFTIWSKTKVIKTKLS